MAKGEKFIALSRYLEENNNKEVMLGFNEIERLIGRKLCKSAYIYKAYWNLSDTHTFPISWIQAGYRLKSLDLSRKIATFIKSEVNIE